MTPHVAARCRLEPHEYDPPVLPLKSARRLVELPAKERATRPCTVEVVLARLRLTICSATVAGQRFLLQPSIDGIHQISDQEQALVRDRRGHQDGPEGQILILEAIQVIIGTLMASLKSMVVRPPRSRFSSVNSIRSTST